MNQRHRRTILRAGFTLAVAACRGSALATQSGKTAQGVDYLSGGVSHEELRTLHERRNAYSLWVITAASKSGSHLTDVLVTVRDSAHRVVYSGPPDGPWLFINLPLGRYQVEAALNGKAQQRTTTIHRGDHHQVFFYFDTGDEVSEENRPPFDGNPYSGQKKR
jgi:hypothetical protein